MILCELTKNNTIDTTIIIRTRRTVSYVFVKHIHTLKNYLNFIEYDFDICLFSTRLKIERKILPEQHIEHLENQKIK